MSFSGRLQELRKAKGWTQAELAKQSGLGPGTIRDYEQGRREPSLDSAFRLAEALGVSVEEFKNGMKTPPEAPAPATKAKGKTRKGR